MGQRRSRSKTHIFALNTSLQTSFVFARLHFDTALSAQFTFAPATTTVRNGKRPRQSSQILLRAFATEELRLRRILTKTFMIATYAWTTVGVSALVVGLISINLRILGSQLAQMIWIYGLAVRRWLIFLGGSHRRSGRLRQVGNASD